MTLMFLEYRLMKAIFQMMLMKAAFDINRLFMVSIASILV